VEVTIDFGYLCALWCAEGMAQAKHAGDWRPRPEQVASLVPEYRYIYKALINLFAARS
jgi:hypothetical protein